MKVYSGGKHHQISGPSLPPKPISQRRFLKEVSAVSAGLLAAGCLPNPPLETPLPTSTPILTPSPTFTPTSAPTGTPTGAPTYPPTTTPTAVPTLTPTVSPTATPTVAATATPTVLPSATPTALPTATSTPPYLSRVAIAQANSYDRQLVHQQVQGMLDGLGGLNDVISPGDRVAIKPNLTGGTGVQPLPGVSAIESYVTHPEVVRALGELLRDAGAGQLFIVEAIYDWDSYRLWGYEEVRYPFRPA